MATGEIRYIATIDTSQYKKGEKEIENSNKSIEDSSDDTSNRSNKSFLSIAKVGLASLATAAIAVGAVITANIGGAIERVDRLNAFPRVLQTLGVSGEEAKKATDRLSESLKGLPTSLSDGANGVQQFVAAGLTAPRATDAFLALNNALIAGSANASDSQIAIEGLIRGISAGELPTSSLQAILSRLPTVFAALEKSSGKTRDELITLYSANPNQLIDDLIRLNTEGGGGIASLEVQAREATTGIGTSFDNLNTAIQRNLGNIITAFGANNISATVQSITTFVDNLGKTFGDIVTTYIVPFAQQLQAAFAVVLSNQQVLDGLNVILLTIGIAIGIVIGVLGLAAIGFAAVTGAVSFLIGEIIRSIVVISTFVGTIGNSIGQLAVGIYNNVTGIFSRFTGFFATLWSNITSLFSNVGVSIGNAIGGTVKTAINSILRGAVGIVNGFVDAINGVIGVIDAIPGVDIGKIGRLNVPALANGGIVTSPTLALVGEGRESEAVIPLSKLDAMINNDGGGARTEYNINQITISSEVDGDRWLRRLTNDQEIVSNGLVPRQTYMGGA